MHTLQQRAAVVAIISVLGVPAVAGGLNQPVIQQAPTAPTVAAATIAPRAPSNWGGFYIGGQVGTVSADSDVPASEFFDVIGDETVSIGIDGTSAGVHLGYMFDLGNFVLGAELDYDQLSFDDASASFEGESESIDIDEEGSIARLKLRAGYNLGSFLPYATAGVAQVEIEDETADGTFYGVGIAFKATENILIGGEYLHHSFEDALIGFEDDYDVEADTFTLRASYRF